MHELTNRSGTHKLSLLLLQMLHVFFYGLPLLGAFVYGLLKPGCAWMSDWTVFLAGALIQVTPRRHTVDMWSWLWMQSSGHRCYIPKWVALTVCCITRSLWDNSCLWLIKVKLKKSLPSVQRDLTRVTAIKLLVVSFHPANNHLDHIYPLKHISCNKQELPY